MNDDEEKNTSNKSDNIKKMVEKISQLPDQTINSVPEEPLTVLGQLNQRSNAEKNLMLAENVVIDMVNGMSENAVADRYHITILQVKEHLENNKVNIKKYHEEMLKDKLLTAHSYVAKQLIQIIRAMLEYEMSSEEPEIKFQMAAKRADVLEKYIKLFSSGPILAEQQRLVQDLRTYMELQ